MAATFSLVGLTKYIALRCISFSLTSSIFWIRQTSFLYNLDCVQMMEMIPEVQESSTSAFISLISPKIVLKQSSATGSRLYYSPFFLFIFNHQNMIQKATILLLMYDNGEQDNAQLRQLRMTQSLRHQQQRMKFESTFQNNSQPNFLAREHGELVLEGVPSQFRNYVWPQLVPNLCRIQPPYYHFLIKQYHQQMAYLLHEENINKVRSSATMDLAQSGVFSWGRCEQNPENTVNRLHVWLKNIKLDIPRTFPQMKIFHMDQEQHQKLANILSAFAIFREDIGYVQGLSGIAVLLLQQLGTEYRAFTALATIITTTCLYQFFTFQHQGIQSFCDSMKSQLRFEDQEILALLNEYDIDPKTFVVKWVMTLFTRSFQLDSILNLWDILFLHNLSPYILQTLCVSILLSRKKLLTRSHQHSQILKVIHSRLTPHEEEHVFAIMRSLQPSIFL